MISSFGWDSVVKQRPYIHTQSIQHYQSVWAILFSAIYFNHFRKSTIRGSKSRNHFSRYPILWYWWFYFYVHLIHHLWDSSYYLMKRVMLLSRCYVLLHEFKWIRWWRRKSYFRDLGSLIRIQFDSHLVLY